jgi:mannose-6-phosphate isomerase-like protein (cupin superfamily)
MNSDEVKIIKKPWGEEVWFAHTESYAGKILRIKKGHRYSLQYHEKKKETQYIYSGKIKLTFGEDLDSLQEIVLNPGDKFEVQPPLIHRMEALEDSEVFEVSTPELDDVVKLQDDYGRSGSGNNFDEDAELHQKMDNSE